MSVEGAPKCEHPKWEPRQRLQTNGLVRVEQCLTCGTSQGRTKQGNEHTLPKYDVVLRDRWSQKVSDFYTQRRGYYFGHERANEATRLLREIVESGVLEGEGQWAEWRERARKILEEP
jgi:hypothetical protein